MRYIVMDMEWNTAYSKRKNGFMNEIIEIGAVMLNAQMEELSTFSVIIKPQVGKKLHGRVKALTHITNEEIAGGIPLGKALENFKKWLGTEENMFLTWGDGDIRTLIANCKYFFGNDTLPFVHNYADLQKYCQSFMEGLTGGQQIGLSAAAEKLGIDPDAYPHHRALDDSLLSADCLRKVFDAEKLSRYAHACNADFYARLSFKPYVIGDMNHPLVDKSKFNCVCDVCSGSVRRITDWRSSGSGFRATFYCGKCKRKFRMNVRFKKYYDRLDIKRTFSEVVEEPKPAEEQTTPDTD